jgi:hypothetical protein
MADQEQRVKTSSQDSVRQNKKKRKEKKRKKKPKSARRDAGSAKRHRHREKETARCALHGLPEGKSPGPSLLRHWLAALFGQTGSLKLDEKRTIRRRERNNADRGQVGAAGYLTLLREEGMGDTSQPQRTVCEAADKQNSPNRLPCHADVTKASVISLAAAKAMRVSWPAPCQTPRFPKIWDFEGVKWGHQRDRECFACSVLPFEPPCSTLCLV